tara:strand:- start:1293 stop:1622 length:330 start_codon:yes stop_codon:yes gene_type:complete
MYNVILWKDNDNEDIHVFKNKPTFSELYKLIGCDLIEIQQGYTDEHKTFDMYCDEESKLKNTTYPNKRATKAWYAWIEKNNRYHLPGDHIAGTVAIVKKQKFKPKEING